MKVDIKPMTVNQAYTGRRFKTKTYKKYIDEVMIQLKPMMIPDGNLQVVLQVGVSNQNFDVDNCAKPFIDILQKRYGFNDNRIYSLLLLKRVVSKGNEYISFGIHKDMEG